MLKSILIKPYGRYGITSANYSIKLDFALICFILVIPCIIERSTELVLSILIACSRGAYYLTLSAKSLEKTSPGWLLRFKTHKLGIGLTNRIYDNLLSIRLIVNVYCPPILGTCVRRLCEKSMSSKKSLFCGSTSVI